VSCTIYDRDEYGVLKEGRVRLCFERTNFLNGDVRLLEKKGGTREMMCEFLICVFVMMGPSCETDSAGQAKRA
jgi:hypothetical protein